MLSNSNKKEEKDKKKRGGEDGEEEREGKVSAVIPHPNTLPEYTKKKKANAYIAIQDSACL